MLTEKNAEKILNETACQMNLTQSLLFPPNFLLSLFSFISFPPSSRKQVQFFSKSFYSTWTIKFDNNDVILFIKKEKKEFQKLELKNSFWIQGWNMSFSSLSFLFSSEGETCSFLLSMIKIVAHEMIFNFYSKRKNFTLLWM